MGEGQAQQGAPYPRHTPRQFVIPAQAFAGMTSGFYALAPNGRFNRTICQFSTAAKLTHAR